MELKKNLYRTDRATSGDTLRVSINSDTSSIYSWTQLEGNGTSATSTRDSGVSYLYIPNLTANTSTASIFVPIDIYIPNYTSTTNKPISSFSAKEDNATLGYIDARAHLFRNSTAISSLVLSPYTGPNFVSGSSFFLYGIKNS